MIYHGIVGFVMVAALMYLLMSKKLSPLVVMVLVPIIGGLIAGFSIKEVFSYAASGVSGNVTNALTIAFAIIFFSTIIDTGAFNRMVNVFIKRIGNNIILLTVLTVVITIIGHLDGAGASTFLIAIVPLYPIYKKLKVNRMILLCLCCLTAGICNIVPWGGNPGRAAAALSLDVNEIWHYCIPMQIVGIVAMFGMAVFFGVREKRRLISEGTYASDKNDIVYDPNEGLDPDLLRPKLFIVNILLILAVILAMIFSGLQSHVIFMVAAALALIINYRGAKLQLKVLRSHCSDAFFVTGIIFAAGCLSGVMTKSDIASSMAELVVSIMPKFLTPHLHVIWSVITTPLIMCGVNADCQIYGVYPVIANVVQAYGVAPVNMAAFLLMPFGIASFIAPATAATYLAIGLADTQIDEHMKFSFKYCWIVALIMVVAGLLFGIVPF